MSAKWAGVGPYLNKEEAMSTRWLSRDIQEFNKTIKYFVLLVIAVVLALIGLGLWLGLTLT